MQSHVRPMGPRTAAVRPSSPSTATVLLPETSPLNIRKNNRPTLTSPIPTARPTTPKPPIKLAIPAINGTSDGPDSPSYSYYGGPAVVEHDATIHPTSSTEMPPSKNAKGNASLSELIVALDEIEKGSSTDSVTPQAASPQSWSDDVLEEIQRLGEGAGGAVHKVKDKRTGEIIARKTITTREAPMKQLLRELSIVSSNAHVNIISFHGAYMSPSTSEVKIVMEFCEGGSLEAVGKRIKERGAVIGEKIAGRLAEGIFQGLAYLHSKRTIHRDIKPSNILLSREGVVKLCDFGVSGELVESQAGTFTGTSFYMAPERISGQRNYTIRADVWSTGISLLELVQNRFPFPTDMPPIELMLYITTAEPPRLEDESGVQWSEDMKDFIKQTLIRNSSVRPTPKDMLEHPWIVSVMKQDVNMARWIRQVWNWPKRKSGEGSRPATSNGQDES